MAKNIQKEKVLFVEGKDEVGVFEVLLQRIGINDIQIISSGGNIQFKNLFPSIIKSPDFSDVVSYGIIQDADVDCGAALKRIQHVLDRCQEPVPTQVNKFVERNGRKVGVYLMPGNGAPGMLEDLYLATLEGAPVLECVNVCISELAEACSSTSERGQFTLPANLAKARALGTFMATSEPLNCLGLAARAGYWNFDHGAMADVTDFLRGI